jgi:hypothetical protein
VGATGEGDGDGLGEGKAGAMVGPAGGCVETCPVGRAVGLGAAPVQEVSRPRPIAASMRRACRWGRMARRSRALRLASIIEWVHLSGTLMCCSHVPRNRRWRRCLCRLCKALYRGAPWRTTHAGRSRRKANPERAEGAAPYVNSPTECLRKVGSRDNVWGMGEESCIRWGG